MFNSLLCKLFFIHSSLAIEMWSKITEKYSSLFKLGLREEQEHGVCSHLFPESNSKQHLKLVSSDGLSPSLLWFAERI